MFDRTTKFSLLTVLFGVFSAWLLLGLPRTGIDDADIFFVYARHFAEGHGFVYNVGGERVEGFTSLLWTLAGAGWYSVFRTFEAPLLILNIVLAVVAVSACLERTDHRRTYLLLLAGAPAWFAWCQLTLMETGLWCVLLTLLGLAVAEKRRGAAALMLPLLLITRPESMAWGLWIILLVFCFAEKGARLRSAVPVLGTYLGSLALLLGFRNVYFGWPVPNTYYAKISPGLFTNILNGLDYPLGYLISSMAVTAALLIFISLPVVRRKASPLSLRLAWFLLPGLGIPVLVGGDHFGSFRFYQPLWPLLCLIAANEWNRTAAPRFAAKRRRWVLPLFVLLGWLEFSVTGNLKHEFRIAEEGRKNGAALMQLFGDLDTLPTAAAITAGGHKLGYDGVVYDLMGLNSTEMAHAPGDASNFKNHTGFSRSVFYRWEPDVVFCGESAAFDALVLNGLHREPRFQAAYEKCTLQRNGAALTAWYRRGFLAQLPERRM